MKLVRIPFRWRPYPDQNRFQLAILNDGLTACRRLGFNAVAVEFGKSEMAEAKCWAYSGGYAIQNNRLVVGNADLRLISAPQSKRVIFHCKVWDGGGKEIKKLLKDLKTV